MKKGRQRVSSPRSEVLQPAALPKFVQVGDRQVPSRSCIRDRLGHATSSRKNGFESWVRPSQPRNDQNITCISNNPTANACAHRSRALAWQNIISSADNRMITVSQASSRTTRPGYRLHSEFAAKSIARIAMTTAQTRNVGRNLGSRFARMLSLDEGTYEKMTQAARTGSEMQATRLNMPCPGSFIPDPSVRLSRLSSDHDHVHFSAVFLSRNPWFLSQVSQSFGHT
jgi:hypothetical protein